MRSRNIKPSFFKNEVLVKLPESIRLLFIGLWCLADRKGRLEDRPDRIKMEIYPSDPHNIDTMLDQLQHHAFIIRYILDENRYIQIVNFEKHQFPNIKEKDSTIPSPYKHSTKTVPARLCTGVLNTDVLVTGVLNPSNTLAQAPKRKPFVIPTAQEVLDYAKQQGFKIDADKFLNHYGASGWMRGKSKITNWKMCANTWKNNGGPNAPRTTSHVRNLSGDPERTKAYAE